MDWIDSWPGLRALWFDGRPAGLGWAIAFAFALNAALLSTFVWPRWLPDGFALALWLTAALIWLGALAFRLRNRSGGAPTRRADESDSLFIQAQTEYLKGNWDEAVWMLRKQLARQRRDVESRLALATIYRRQGKQSEARQHLQVLGGMDQADQWADELAREWRYLESMNADEHQDSEPTNHGETAPDSTVQPIPPKISTTAWRQAA
jgi:hypothetical protein